MNNDQSAAPTVASEAIATGKPALARSFRFHRPRGPICAGGHCSQCEIATARGHALACQTPAGSARGGRPSRMWGLLGRLAELMRPWFYEHRFLRPRFMRRPWLHLLRHLSSAPPLGEHGAVATPRRFVELEAETVIVGNGEGYPDAFTVHPSGGDVIVGVYPERVLGLLRGDELLSVHFERLVLATGSYERLPPIGGADLPGVIGLDALERYGAQGAIRAGTRVAAWAPVGAHADIRLLAARLGAELVWLSETAPERIEGRDRVTGIVAKRPIACDLFVTGVRQPALELAQQGGAELRLTEGELPILVAADTPDWMELVGDAAATTSAAPDVTPDPDAIVCLCEDVRASDIRACVAQGFDSSELVKRRTGAMTGPCQGKMCAASVLAELRAAGVEPRPTRARPLARPITLGELAADA